MDRKFKCLEEVTDYAHCLIRDRTEKELKALNPLELLEWFIALQRFVAEEAIQIVKDANIKIPCGYLITKVECFWDDSRHGGFCSRKQCIVIGTKCIFYRSKNQLLATIIHELTHLKVRGHGDDFWQEYLRLLKINGLAKTNLTIEEAFYKDTISDYRHPSNKLPLLNRHFLPEITTGSNILECHINFEKKYHLIRRNKIFGRDNCNNIRRLNNITFKEEIIQLCQQYEVNYNKIYKLINDYLPEFNGIDKGWNPYAHLPIEYY